MYRRSIILVILLLLFAAEAFFARQFYIEIVPFPEDEWWMTVVNNCLRDLLLAGVAGLLYFRRNRLADRTKRYFPVVVIGVLYLLIAGFMVNQLSLDKGFLTVLAILTGLNNNTCFPHKHTKNSTRPRSAAFMNTNTFGTPAQ